MTERRLGALGALPLLLGFMLGGCGGDGDMKQPMPDGVMSMAGMASGPSGDEPLAVNGCAAADYQDMSDESAERVVQIAAEGLTFTPPCMMIAVGQSVTFQGSLSAHPLAPGNANDAATGSPDSPIVKTSSGDSVSFTFENPGTFPYFCQLHSFGTGMGMAGAVYVQ